jgi:hypothetical protein
MGRAMLARCTTASGPCLALSIFLVASTSHLPSAVGKVYRYESLPEHVATMERLARAYPHLMQLHTAQERYGLKAVGSCAGMPGRLCLQHFMVLTNHTSLQEMKPVQRPAIFISGTLHGNELVGPTATVAAAEWLLTRAAAHPLLAHTAAGNTGIRHLLNTRIVVIFPFANADGFANRRREEAGRDPNRDFAFDVNPHACMQTMAGRAINEVFREFIFYMSITFHGGANVIAYQWGDTRHCRGYPRNCLGGYISSDDRMMKSVGIAMSKFASNSPSEGRYAAGPCNDPRIIYPVHGGMEDWAYGASWHKSSQVCTPTSHGGYPAEKTRYNNVTHRMPNFLVEASSNKIPPARELGTDEVSAAQRSALEPPLEPPPLCPLVLPLP